MANLDLTKYGITGSVEIIRNPSYEELYKEEKASHTIRKENKVYPNDPCPCGSGKKYKKCHGRA